MEPTISATVLILLGVLHGAALYQTPPKLHLAADLRTEQYPSASLHHDNPSRISNVKSLCPVNCTCVASKVALTIENCSSDPGGHLNAIILEHVNVTKLSITRSRLSELPPAVCNLTRLSVLNISHNHLSDLPWACLKALKLKIINVSYNHITHLKNGTLYDFKYLRKIYLNHNNISDIDLDVFTQSDRLPSLGRIDLDSNLLESVDIWPLQLLTVRPMNISLAKNLISNFTNLVGFEYKCNQETLRNGRLSLSRNNVTHFGYFFNGWDMADDLKIMCFLSQENVRVSMYENPFNCDCIDYDIYRLLRLQPSVIFDHAMFCAEPPRLYRRNVLSVPLDDFICEVKENCPNRCGCQNIPNQLNMTVNCRGAGLTTLPLGPLPHLPKHNYRYTLDLSDNQLKTLWHRSYLDLVKEAYFSNNKINEVSLQFLSSLTNASVIHLNGNKLQRLPTNVSQVSMSMPNDILLHDNSWECDCHEKETRAWIISMGSGVTDREGILCAGPPRVAGTNMLLLPEDRFICGETRHVNYILISVVCSTLAVMIICVVLLFSCYINRVRLHRKFQWHPFDSDECVGEEKEFDAFLAYAEEDSTYVTDYLIPELEHRGYKVAHNRVNFMGGRPIIDNITDCIRRSKRTLAVLSNNFLQSRWCLFELTTALEVDKIQGTHRLLCMSLCELSFEGLDTSIRSYLEKKSCISFDSSHFWSQLEYHLPAEKNGSPPRGSPVDAPHGDSDTDTLIG